MCEVRVLSVQQIQGGCLPADEGTAEPPDRPVLMAPAVLLSRSWLLASAEGPSALNELVQDKKQAVTLTNSL